MASEYLKWKYRDVKPDEPPPELTGKEKLANWFYYHKWWVVLWAFLLFSAGGILWNALGIGRVRPDYVFAYVGNAALRSDCAAALERELAALGQDVNGDGKVVVELRQYVSNANQESSEESLMYGYASDVTLIADITNGDSYFFLLEDPAAFQRAYQALAGPDGSLPEDSDHSIDGRVFQWSDCPVLAGLELGGFEEEYLGQSLTGDNQELLSRLYFGRRGFYDEKQAVKQGANEAFWGILTEGAVK